MKWTFKQFMKSYLVERDVQKAISFVTDDICSVGVNRGATICSKVELEKFLLKEVEQDPQPFEIVFEDLLVKQLGWGGGQIFARLTICRKKPNEPEFWFKIDQTVTLCSQAGQYKICALHISWDLVQEEKTREALRISEQRFQIALSLTSHIVFEYHLDTGQVYHFNRNMGIHGILQTLQHVPQSLVEDGVIHPAFAEEFMLMYEKIRTGEQTASCVIQTRLKDGTTYIWNKITLMNIFDQVGHPVRAVGIIEDITNQREAEIKYAQEEQYRMVLFSNAMMTYEMNISRDCFLKGHQYWCDWMEGLENNQYQALIEKIAHKFIHRDDRKNFLDMHARANLLAAYKRAIYECKSEYRIIDQAGQPVWVCCTIHLLQDVMSQEIKGFAYVRNIDDRKNKEISLQYRAEHDLLTDLYNKQTTEILIQEYLQQVDFNSIHAFMLIDLDDFKAVNDNLGHGFGDAVLAEVARKIQGIFHKSDIIGRIGGDEYVLFLKDVRSEEQVLIKAEELCQAFRYFSVGEKEPYKISGTMGIAFFPQHGITFSALYQKADIALYFAKKLGKDRYAIYDASM